MSRYLSERLSGLSAYTPGEQPRDTVYLKLNTNESPYPPAPEVLERLSGGESSRLNLYPDPDAGALRTALAARFSLAPENVLVGNGSDEILFFAFTAFCDGTRGAAFADVTYGFYPVFCALCGIDCRIIPLAKDFTLRASDYHGLNRMIVIANPNAPTGLAISSGEIRGILESNPDSVVVIDEAYVDFGGESSVPLIREYDNLLVVQTFSKSRSLAGARLGFALGNAGLIADLNRIRCSTNPYNVNRLTLAAGEAALQNEARFAANCREIAQTRQKALARLRELGFSATDSKTNFLFLRSPDIGGEALYLELKKRRILVRHFSGLRTSDYVRVTVGTPEQMETFLAAVQDILSEIRR